MESKTRRAEEQRLIDAKIAAIKKKEELIKKRQQEIEEDIRLAEEMDAVVKLKPVSDDWFPGKTSQLKPTNRVCFGEVEEMTSKQLPYRGRGKGRRHDEQRVGGPPPDPISFLADPERDYGPPEVDAIQSNHHQPRNNWQEPPRQELPPKNLNENWRSDEKRLASKPIKTENDWRDKPKNLDDRNWREDLCGEPIRDDKNPTVKIVNMQQDWRRPQAQSQGRSFQPTGTSEGLYPEANRFEQLNHTQYLPNPNDKVQDPEDLRNRLTNRRAEPKPQLTFVDEDSWETPLNAPIQLPPQIPEPVRQTVFDTLPNPANSEIRNLQRGFDEPDPMQNAVYYANSKPVACYEQVRKTAEPSQVYRGESDDSWEGNEKFFVNQSKIQSQNPPRTEFQQEDPEVWNYYQDPPPQVGHQYLNAQRFESSNPQVLDRMVKSQPHITDNGQPWNQDSQRVLDFAPNAGKNQAGENVYPVGQWNESKPPVPYSSELQYEQVMQRSQGKPPNPVYPASYDRQPPLNQQAALANSSMRQSSALNAGRPDDAYAYFQAKMAKAQSHSHHNTNPEMDELQTQFSKMSAVPDRRVLSAANTQPQKYQYAEMNSARQQTSANFQPPNANQYQYPYDELSQHVGNQPPQRLGQEPQHPNQYQYDDLSNNRQAANQQTQRLREEAQRLKEEAQRLREESQLASQYQFSEMSGRQQIPNSQSQRIRDHSHMVNQYQYDEVTSGRQQLANQQSQRLREESQLAKQYQYEEMNSSRHVNPHQFAEMASLRQRHQATTAPQVQNSNPQQHSELSNTRQKQQPLNANNYQFSELNNARQQKSVSHQQPYPEMNSTQQQVPLSNQQYAEINTTPQSHCPNQHPYAEGTHQQGPQSTQQYAEMMNARLAGAYDAEAKRIQTAENTAALMHNQHKSSSINDRLRRSREQALDHGSFVGHGAEASCQTDEPLLVQSYASQMEARHNPNIVQRSHPPGDSYTPDNLVSTTERYLNVQYEPPPVKQNPSPNQYNNENRNIPRQSIDQLPLTDETWTAQNMAEMQQLAGQAIQQSSQPSWNVQSQQIGEQAQSGSGEESYAADNESLLAFQNELVAHATDRIQARVNSALNDRLKRARDAALQERFEPSPQFPPNQIPSSDQPPSGQRPMGRAIKGCQSQPLPGENQQKLPPTQFDNWQGDSEGRRVNVQSVSGSPSELSDGEQQRPESVQSLLLAESEVEEPLEITLPACVDLTKPPPVIIPPVAVSPVPPEQFSKEIAANIFSSPPPTIPELNPDSDDIDSLIAKPYYQYESPTTNQSFRPKLTFSLEKKAQEKGENSSLSTATSSKPSSTQSDGEEVVLKRITAAERVAKLLETPVVLPDHTPSYVLKVLGEEEIRNIKSRTAGSNQNAQNVRS